MDGLHSGFRLGFDHSRQLKSAKKNKPSANQHADANEVSLERVLGPFPSPPLPDLHVSSFGVIPKRGQPGKWRLNVDLSSPGGLSVNDGINPEDFSLPYITVDQIISMVSKFGRGALMAKFDVEAAYRNIAVLCPNVPDFQHYLGNFITAGPPNSDQCARIFNTSATMCNSLGLPLHPDKCLGPSSVLVVLGIELDSNEQVAPLPADKFVALQQLVTSWLSCHCCTKNQLESLIGHLHHAAKVVWSGRTFLRPMINLLCCFCRDDHPIRRNSEFKLDL